MTHKQLHPLSIWLSLLVLLMILVSALNPSLGVLAAANIAQGKTASADSVQTANPVANGNDGSTTTRWCAADGNLNHWWKVDLGASYALSGSEVMWEKSGVVYKYKVEVSTDNTNWTMKVDKTANTSTAQTQNDPFTGTARYVRITVTGLSTNPVAWASFFEFRVFDTSGGPTNTPGGPTSTNTPIVPTPTRTPTSVPGSFVMGADVSSLLKAQDLGAVYKYENGTVGNALQILKDHGMSYVRLRVWVNPASGYNNQAKVVTAGTQAKALGLKLLIDFHYSDTWADPGHQVKPAAWASHTFAQLQTDVYNHTLSVCNALKAAGATPDMIQVGNEITPGMLLPDGSTSNWTNLAALLNQGYNAVKACSSSIQVILHIDKGGDNAASRSWFDNAQSHGVQWDAIGESYYCFWHGTMSAMKSNVTDLKSRYGKPVYIVETAYPFTTANADSEANVVTSSTPCSGYSASVSGQDANFQDVITNARNGGAAGVFYWEPTWMAVTGNGWDPTNPNSGDQWDNMALFNASGVALQGMSRFLQP